MPAYREAARGAAESEEVCDGIGAQHAEREDDQASDGLWPGGGRRLDGEEETVAAAREGLDEAGCVGGVAERFADLVDAEVESLLKIDEGVRPDAVANVVAGEDLTAMSDEQLQTRNGCGGSLTRSPWRRSSPAAVSSSKASNLRIVAASLIENSCDTQGIYMMSKVPVP